MKKLLMAFIFVAIALQQSSSLEASTNQPSSSWFSWPIFNKQLFYKSTAALITLGLSIALYRMAKKLWYTPVQPPEPKEAKPKIKRSLSYYAQKFPLDCSKLELAIIANQTTSFSNRELKLLCDKAARCAGFAHRTRIKHSDFENALKLMSSVRTV